MARSQELTTAIEAIRAAEKVIRQHYLQEVEVRLKPDESPVTVADVEAEKAIRKIITEQFPTHGFYGEETGKHNADADYLWLIDPIDGTKSFVREYPFFSTQIALMHKGELILGVSNAPIFGEMAWAERGSGAFLNDKPISTSRIDKLSQSTLSTGNIKTLANNDKLWAGYAQMVRCVSRTRGYGDFYHYHLLAAGKIDAVVESDVNILDIAALAVIIEEAGGQFTQLDGQPIDLDTTTVLASNKILHDTVLNAFLSDS